MAAQVWIKMQFINDALGKNALNFKTNPSTKLINRFQFSREDKYNEKAIPDISYYASLKNRISLKLQFR